MKQLVWFKDGSSRFNLIPADTWPGNFRRDEGYVGAVFLVWGVISWSKTPMDT